MYGNIKDKNNWINFLAYYIESFSPKVLAAAAGVVVNYPLTNQKDGCKFLENSQCPLEKDEYISYTLTMPVLKIFPKVRLFHISYLIFLAGFKNVLILGVSST